MARVGNLMPRLVFSADCLGSPVFTPIKADISGNITVRTWPGSCDPGTWGENLNLPRVTETLPPAGSPPGRRDGKGTWKTALAPSPPRIGA